ncbi:MAG: hypothetical protein KY439_02145 [Actinobacteria bacterium]|nr:hypothetical protein [Actinomycetota bacterium]
MAAIFFLTLRTQLTRGRILALGAIAALAVGLAVSINRAVSPFNRAEAAYDLVENYGLALLVPLTALVFAAAALGDPAEDGTLVYLWQRPIARWKLAVAALAGAVAIAMPFAVVPTALAAAIAGGDAELVAGAAGASLLAVVAYSTLFLGLGLVVRRALAWGLVYVLIWEGFVARSGTGPARLSVLLYARSILADVAGHAPPRLGASTAVAVAVPLVLGALALAATTQFLRRIDVR